MAGSKFQINLTRYNRIVIHKLLGNSNKTLTTEIAQVLQSSAEKLEEWKSIIRPGVVCLVEDLDKNSLLLLLLTWTRELLFGNSTLITP